MLASARLRLGTRVWALERAVPALGVTAAVALLLVRLAPDVRGKPLYEDEALAGLTASRSLADVLHTVHDRGGAPLHFVLAHVALTLDPSPDALRWLSVVFALATVPVCFDLGRRLAGADAGVAAALLVASSQMLGIYGTFGRMYSLFAFASALAVDLFVRAVDLRTGRAAFVAAAAAWLLPAVHPFGIVLLVAEAAVGVVVWRGRNIRAALPVLALALALVPFAFSDVLLAHRFSTGADRPRELAGPDRAAEIVIRALRAFGGGRGVLFPVLVAAVVVGAVVLWRRGRRPVVVLLGLALVGLPVLVAVARAAGGVSDYLAARQVVFVLPLWAGAAGAGIAALCRTLPGGARAGVLAAVAAAALLSPSVLEDPRSPGSGSPAALAAPGAFVEQQARPDAVLFPNSTVYLAALPTTHGLRTLSREQPVLMLRELRRTRFPVSKLLVAVPLEETDVRDAGLVLPPGLEAHRFQAWLLLVARGPFADRQQLLHRLEAAVSVATRAVVPGSRVVDDFLRQSRRSVCGSLEALGDRCRLGGIAVTR